MDIVSIIELVAFVVFGLLAWHFKISYRFSIASGVLLLVFAGISTASGRDDIGNFVAILSYFFLLVGVSLALVEYASKREQNLVATDISAQYPNLGSETLGCMVSKRHERFMDDHVLSIGQLR